MKRANTTSKKQIKKKNVFTADEDDKLRRLVMKYGEGNWYSIASKMKKRSTRQCRDRWVNYLSPLAVNGAWTLEEEELLRLKVQLYGRKWKFITQFFPGRTDINIKNRYNFLIKRDMKALIKSSDSQEFHNLMNFQEQSANAPSQNCFLENSSEDSKRVSNENSADMVSSNESSSENTITDCSSSDEHSEPKENESKVIIDEIFDPFENTTEMDLFGFNLYGFEYF
ncbi:Transcription factor WER [Tritrichomonas foetus]|uniref:Transcription factor WER n=1 Tax=Tritrichomonas foetus TaxID=1144522 RepID=A0A1J4L356_9EUKA|nr:Transcription factor WER [Tritrichomonas foetus]|eukprot:OHT16349.1 Transcription factor WER [Tritrichomonas foetus]